MDSPLRLLMSGDNGEAGAGGQRPQGAFPKGFEALVWRLLLDLSARMNPQAPNQLFSIDIDAL